MPLSVQSVLSYMEVEVQSAALLHPKVKRKLCSAFVKTAVHNYLRHLKRKFSEWGAGKTQSKRSTASKLQSQNRVS